MKWYVCRFALLVNLFMFSCCWFKFVVIWCFIVIGLIGCLYLVYMELYLIVDC